MTSQVTKRDTSFIKTLDRVYAIIRPHIHRYIFRKPLLTEREKIVKEIWEKPTNASTSKPRPPLP